MAFSWVLIPLSNSPACSDHCVILIILNFIFQVREWKLCGHFTTKKLHCLKTQVHTCTSHLHSAELWGWVGVPPEGFILILTQCVSLASHRESAQQVEMEGTTATLTSRVLWTQRTSGGFSMTVGTLFSACTFANTSCCDGEHFFLCFGLLIPY